MTLVNPLATCVLGLLVLRRTLRTPVCSPPGVNGEVGATVAAGTELLSAHVGMSGGLVPLQHPLAVG